MSVSNAFMPSMAAAATVSEPTLDLAAAVQSAAKHLGISLERSPKTLRAARGTARITSVDGRGVSLAPIEGRLMWLPIRHGMMKLVWNFQIHTLDDQHVYDFNVGVESYSRVEECVVLPDVRIGSHSRIRRAILDKACRIASGTLIGENRDQDAQRFQVTAQGIVLVTPDMLGQEIHHVR